MSNVLQEKYSADYDEENPVSLEEETAPPELDLSAIAATAAAGAAAAAESIRAALEEVAATNELIARATLARSFVYRDKDGSFQFDAFKFKKCFSIVEATMETEENAGQARENSGQ